MKKPKKERSGECQELVGSWKRHGGGSRIDIPINWERIMIEAAQNPDFKKSLLVNREEAIAHAGFRLSDSESAMLAALSPETLEVMIRNIPDPGRLKNRRFAKTVAAAAMVSGIMVANIHCEEPHVAGATDADADMDSDSDTDTDTDTNTDTDTDTNTDTDTDTGTDTGVDPDAGTDGGSDAGK